MLKEEEYDDEDDEDDDEDDEGEPVDQDELNALVAKLDALKIE